MSNAGGKRGWVKTESGYRPTDQRMLQIMFQIEAGCRHKDIAAQFQVSRSRISRIARRLGRPDSRHRSRRTKISTA